jgi:hypothetical protein
VISPLDYLEFGKDMNPTITLLCLCQLRDMVSTHLAVAVQASKPAIVSNGAKKNDVSDALKAFLNALQSLRAGTPQPQT